MGDQAGGTRLFIEYENNVKKGGDVYCLLDKKGEDRFYYRKSGSMKGAT